MTRSPWLSIIGVGDDGAASLSSNARALLAQAELIIGGARHLALIGDSIAEKMAWPSPMTDALPRILAMRGRSVVVLASGDPFFFGVGEMLSRHVSGAEIFCVPAPSAFSLVAAQLKWSQQECALLSLHGRAFERLLPQLQPGRRLIVLSWDETTPARIAAYLAQSDMGDSRIYVLEHIGGAQQRVRDARAKDFCFDDIAPLNTVGIEVSAGPDARIIPRVAGLPDDWFENDGQLTKSEIRALTLSALAPRRGELLWDIGAGSGSVAIEWMLADTANRAIAIERDATRAARIVRNALALGAPDLTIVTGAAPEALTALETPDAIFIGGGATPETLSTAWQALPMHGRLVVNAVTIETQQVLAQFYREKGGRLLQVQVARARPVGRFHGFDPGMTVTQWCGSKQ